MRSPALISVLSLLAALAITAALFVDRTPLKPPEAATPDETPIDEAPAADNAVRSAVAEGDESTPADATEQPEPEVDDDRAEIAIDRLDAALGPLVRVRRASDRSPAAGVEIAWVGVDEGNRRRGAVGSPYAQLDEFDQPFTFGQRAHTDQQGELRLPPLRDLTYVAVRDGSLFAATRVAPDEARPTTLWLVPDTTVKVRVVDEAKRGLADIPLSIARVVGGNAAEQFWAGRSDRNGNAEVRHFQLRRPEAKSRRNESFQLLAQVPFQDQSRAFVGFAAEPLPTSPVTLVLPTTVPVSMSLRHRSGAPVLTRAFVGWHVARPEGATPKPAPPNFDQGGVRKPLGPEAVTGVRFGLGLQIDTSVAIDGTRSTLKLQSFATPPTVADQGIDLALTLPDECSVVALRLVDADGVPLGDREFRGVVQAGPQQLAMTRLATMADGRCDLLMLPSTANPARLVVRDERDDGSVWIGIADLGIVAGGERRDVGDLRLQPAPLLARGGVHDDRGEIVANVRLVLEQVFATPRGERWRPVPMLTATTGTDGNFALHGPLPSSAFRLRAEAKGLFPFTSELLSPGAVLDVRMLRHGVLTGRVLLPDWLPPQAGSLSLQPAVEGKPARSFPIRQKRGYVWCGELEPGLYTATVTIRNLHEPLATLDGVRIDPGTNEDARLQPLDLSGSLYRYRLRAITAGGRELGDLDGPILWRPARPGGEPGLVTFRWQKGKAELIVPAPYLELTTLGRGLRPTSFALAAGDHDVYLDPVQPFVVVLPGVRGAAGLLRAIRVSAVFTGETGLPQGAQGKDQRSGEDFAFPRWELGKSGGGWLDPYDRAELMLSRGGPHEITLRLYETEKRDGRQSSIALGTVEVVVDGSARQPTVLQVDLRKVEEAVRGFEARAAQGTR